MWSGNIACEKRDCGLELDFIMLIFGSLLARDGELRTVAMKKRWVLGYVMSIDVEDASGVCCQGSWETESSPSWTCTREAQRSRPSAFLHPKVFGQSH